MSDLVKVHNSVQDGCEHSTLMLTFASKHDTPRLAAVTSSLERQKNALAYTLLLDGIPTLYQGEEQGFSGGADPENREAMWLSGFDRESSSYVMIRSMNKLRTWVGRKNSTYWTSTTSVLWSDPNSLAMRKGSDGSHIVVVLTNEGNTNVTETVKVFNSGFAPGTVLLEVVACDEVVVGLDGVLNVELGQGNPRVFFPLNQLAGSDICQRQFFGSRPFLYVHATTPRCDFGPCIDISNRKTLD